MGKSKYAKIFDLNVNNNNIKVNNTTLLFYKKKFYINNGDNTIQISRDQILACHNLFIGINQYTVSKYVEKHKDDKNIFITKFAYIEDKFNLVNYKKGNNNILNVNNNNTYIVDNITKVKLNKILINCIKLDNIYNSHNQLIGISVLENNIYKILLVNNEIYESTNKLIRLDYITINPTIKFTSNEVSNIICSNNNVKYYYYYGPYYEIIKHKKDYNIMSNTINDDDIYDMSQIRYIMDDINYKEYITKLNNSEYYTNIINNNNHDSLTSVIHIYIESNNKDTIYNTILDIHKNMTSNKYILGNNINGIYLLDYINNDEIIPLFYL